MSASSSGDESSWSDEQLAVEQVILKLARNGDYIKLAETLDCHRETTDSLINTTGQTKANRDWTPLILASYFGHYPAVELLLGRGANINAVNDKGDSALHKAAFIGRLDIVTILLKNGADVNLVNIEGQGALNVSRNVDIKNIIKAAQLTESVRREKAFLLAASQGNLTKIEEMMKNEKGLNINCCDEHGNTALHLSALRNHQQLSAYLMQAGLKSSVQNKNDQLAADLATSDGMKKILSVTPMNDLRKTVQRFEGVLFKKSKVFGFKPKYVVLDRGVLTVFSTLADASSGSRRKTYKYLDDAQCLVQSRDNQGMAIVYNNGTSHIFRVPGGKDVSIMRQKWVNSIRSHIAYSTYYMHKGASVLSSESDDDILPLNTISDSLQTARAHQTSLEKEIRQLSTNISTLAAQSSNNSAHVHSATSIKGGQDIVGKCMSIASGSRELCNVFEHCLTLLSQQEQLRSQQLAEEKERCRVLQESLRLLAVQHYELEQHVIHPGTPLDLDFHSPTSMADDILSEEEEFYDCDSTDDQQLAEGENDLDETLIQSPPSTSESMTSLTSDHSSAKTNLRIVQAIHKRTFLSRKQLPVPMISRNDFSVWSVLKQCIGKELSRITMPVVFNEPISFLQRVTEYMEYSYLLDRASVCETAAERMAYVTAFAVSASASNWDRLGKPFNPLLGETFELDRPELGYKVACEQVSHHPPISAFHVSAEDFRFYGTINPKLKFWGKSVEITPKGVQTIELVKHGETYTWENVNGSVHNIIIGKLWMEHYGRMEVTNHKTGHKADITFKKCSMFSKDAHRVEGVVLDARGNRVCNIYGSWTDALFSVPPQRWDEYITVDKQNNKSKPLFLVHEKDSRKLQDCITRVLPDWENPVKFPITNANLDSLKTFGKSLSIKDDEVLEEVPKRASNFNLNLPDQTFLWQADERPENSDKYYSFTEFAIMLNELDEKMKSKLPPTDSRLRPDIRCLELGNIDDAAENKVALEEKQRATRKAMKKEKLEWRPRWFSYTSHPVLNQDDWIFNGAYWNKDWSNCPAIFL